MSALSLYPLIGGSLGAIGAVLLLWSLFHDRSRGRLRCPRCWYRMEGVPENGSAGKRTRTCPECGRASTSERQLHRTRRRKRWAAVALLLLLSGWGVWKYPEARQRGLVTYVPTTLLILSRDLAYEYRWGGSDIGAELLQRVYDGKVNSWQLAKIDPPELGQLLTLPRGDDAVWPEGEPLLVEFSAPSWFWPRGLRSGAVPASLQFTARSADRRAMRVLIGSDEVNLSPFSTTTETSDLLWECVLGSWTSSAVHDAGPPSADADVTSFEWTLMTGEPESVVWTGRHELPVRVVPRDSAELGVEPRRGPALDAAVRDELIIAIDPDSPALKFIIGTCDDPSLADLTLCVRADVLRDDGPVGALRIAAGPGALAAADEHSLPVGREIAAADIVREPGRWRVRLRSDLAAMVYHGLTGPYWDGDFTIPLSEILAR